MNNYAAYFALEKKLHGQGFDFDRKEAIRQFTAGKKSGLRELTTDEYSGLINWLNHELGQLFISSTGGRGSGKEFSQKQRRKIIALLCKVGMIKDDRADMNRIYSWVLTHGYLKKSLNQYTASELPKLVYQAEEFYKSHIERL